MEFPETVKVDGDTKIRYASGATRSADVETVRFDLISPIGLRRLAETYAEGAVKHGDNNWRGGMPVSVLVNHLLAHLNNYIAGDRSEDHLAHAAWGIFAMMEYEATHPECHDLYDFKQGKEADAHGQSPTV